MVFGKTASWYSRIILLGAAIMFMLSGIQTDVIGIILTIALIGIQKFINKSDPRQAVTHEDISASS